MSLGKKPPKSQQTSTTETVWPQEALGIFAEEANLLQNRLLPQQRQQTRALGQLSLGDPGQEAFLNYVDPAMRAGQQGQAAFGAMTGGMPADIRAPLQEQAAYNQRRIPYNLMAAAPGELQSLTHSLISPQFAGLFAPSQRTTSTSKGGGSSPFQQGLGTVGTLAMLTSLFI